MTIWYPSDPPNAVGKCPTCGEDQHRLTFRYKPELVTNMPGGLGNALDEKTVQFIRCGTAMGYAHYSERYESA